MSSKKSPFFYRGATLGVLGALILGLWIGWFAFLIFNGAFPLPEPDKGFEVTGQFGDSFGFLASFMSTMAVLGALFTVHVQSRNYERQQFEQNFYILLNNIRRERDCVTVRIMGPDRISDRIYESANYHKLKRNLRLDRHVFEGIEGVGIQLLRLRDAIGHDGFSDVKQVGKNYRKVMEACSMGNYFRMLYHLYKMVDVAPVRDKFFYTRIIRAHLSGAEARLIAYNCVVGEGRQKFKMLVEKYSVLHNLGREGLDSYASAELAFFQRKIGVSAFRFEEIEPISY